MTSEANMQAQVRLAAAQERVFLMRNNSGALRDDTGRMVRFGLGNDSKQVNDRLKSSDLIGIRPVLIQSHHIGQTIGQFIAIEVKPPDWRGPGGDDHAEAQQRWIELVRSWGGLGGFANSVPMARGVWS